MQLLDACALNKLEQDRFVLLRMFVNAPPPPPNPTNTHHVVLLEAHSAVEAVAVSLLHVSVGLLVEAAPPVAEVCPAVVAAVVAVLSAADVVVPSSLPNRIEKKNSFDL